ncbi:mannose-6-phosphate isomerase, class I [Streptomyces thermocoprophilus]|uniref:mannose-6-phosphate isomerase n=1 Tax=Streptomyces thermocoprophilus TaxID=78356 RepID=A0ABV5V6X2_9ACTN
MDLLEPIIKPYAWGSREALARLTGRHVPSAGPEAELWMGEHPSGPARLVRDGRTRTLREVVSGDPVRELGPECVDRFGGRLPFLLKVIAADQPLSIQVHPDRQQARAAYGAQTANGGEGPYSDDWPKPELLCALSPFEVLAGFRDQGEAAALLKSLGVDRLRPVIELLVGGGDDNGSDDNGSDDNGSDDNGSDDNGSGVPLTEALRTLLQWPVHDRDALVGEVVRACTRLSDDPGPHAAACAAVTRMARHHPGDLGLVASLLMRHQVLRPGSALYMPAGGLHAYVQGVGVEIMAASDNVLRAGLTTKEVNVPELLRVTDPAARVPVIGPSAVVGPSRTDVYLCPAEEFALYRTEPTSTPLPLVPQAGPRIVLCEEGAARLRAEGGETVTLDRGVCCFLPDSDRGVTVEGSGTLFIAGTGLTTHRPDTDVTRPPAHAQRSTHAATAMPPTPTGANRT